MKDQHIISLIENTSFGSISDSDLEKIKAHTAECDSCERAFAAAGVASVMLRERAAQTFEPSPFFQTRVMAHLRERQTASETWSWNRIWRAAGALASSMVATVVALMILTFVIPDAATGELVDASARNGYSVEEVILNPGESPDEVSDGHILTTLYDAAEDTVK